jgi:CRP-like cAMP-binding protein
MSQQLVVSHSHRFTRSQLPAVQRAPALVRFPAQHHLYQQGDPASAAFVIRSGIACLESVNHRGDRSIVHFLGPGALIGHEAWLAEPRCFDARACTEMALEPVATLPRSSPGCPGDSLQEFGVAVSQLLQDITKFRVELHRANAVQRVLLLLEQLRKAHLSQATSIWLPSRHEMADTLDINHVTASRVVAHLFRENVLLRVPRSDEVGVDWHRVHRLLQAEP